MLTERYLELIVRREGNVDGARSHGREIGLRQVANGIEAPTHIGVRAAHGHAQDGVVRVRVPGGCKSVCAIEGCNIAPGLAANLGEAPSGEHRSTNHGQGGDRTVGVGVPSGGEAVIHIEGGDAISRGADGYVSIPSTPGLGIEVDPAILERFRVR